MQRFPWLPVVLCAAIIVSGCEGQTVQQSVRATIEALKVDNTAIDEQSSLVGLNENAVKAAEKTTEAKDEEEKEEEITAKPISPDRARFQAYVKTAAFTIRLREAAISTDAYLGRDCDSAYQTTLLSVLHQPEPALSMPEASEHPVSGIWRTRYRLERCGETLIYNAIFGGKADGPANMRISMPGNTATGSALAREIRADIKDSALERADMKRCTDQRIVDTQAEAPLKEAESDGSVWTKLVHEVWSIDVCGRLVDIALHHGFRDGVGYRQYLIEAIDAPLWRPSGRSVPKDIDLPRLQTALQQVITGKASASLDYL
ncbi:MAG: hypothetical protein O3B74_07830, partial [Proteobacteria bacterium]|nr:hypothetical protein [Pseudomonadota bacterium]